MPRNVTLEELNKINGRTWAPVGVKDAVAKVDPLPARDLHLRDLEEQPSLVIQPRCVYITRDVLEKFGYSANCKRCRALQRGLECKGISHSTECRQSIESKMRADEAYKARVDAADERRTRYLAEEEERDRGGGDGERSEIQGAPPIAPPPSRGVMIWRLD